MPRMWSIFQVPVAFCLLKWQRSLHSTTWQGAAGPSGNPCCTSARKCSCNCAAPEAPFWGRKAAESHVGRPTRQGEFERFLVTELRSGRTQQVGTLQDKEATSWWRKGLGMEEPPEAVQAAAAASNADKVSPRRAKRSKAAKAAKGNHAESPPRRVKTHVSDHAKRWLLVWVRHMVKKYKYTMLGCWRLAQKWAPNVYGKVHHSSFQRWSLFPIGGLQARDSQVQEENPRTCVAAVLWSSVWMQVALHNG